ncbi:MAG: hypothetical protein K9M45_12960 [Kiritimatiellales bacterium]|nr:hypothetical protein [Kiritimatiellales bacterium]
MKRALYFSLLFAVAAAVRADLQAIKRFGETTDQEERSAVEKQIFQCPEENVPALGKELAAILQSPETTHEGKVFACRMLRFISPECAVPALAALLPDPKLSHMARFALQGIEGSEAEKALIDALGKVDARLKPGMLDSLAQRRSNTAVAAIAAMMNSKDSATVLAAINALGRIGTKDAASTLTAAKIPLVFSNDWKRAQLNCATLLAKENPQLAAAIFQPLYATDNPDPVRAAALVGLSKANTTKAVPEVLAQLTSENKLLRRTAIGLLAELPVGGLVGGMGKLSPENQVLAIRALAYRRETAAETAMLNLTKSFDASVKAAAFAALGKVGGTNSVEPLLKASITGNATAFNSLCALNADGVDAAILGQFATADDAAKTKLIEALAARKAPGIMPVLFKTAAGTWSRSCKAAIDAIGTMATEKDFPAIAELLLKTDSENKLKAIEEAILSASQHITDLDACSAPLATAYPQASGQAKYAITRSLGSLGGEQALAILTQAMNSPDAKLQDAAVRGLASWPNIEVADRLLDLAKNADNETHQILALRGYIRLADNLNMYKKAAAATDRPAELKAIISGAAEIGGSNAQEFISGFLENETVRAEAEQAIKKAQSGKKGKKRKSTVAKRVEKPKKKNSGKNEQPAAAPAIDAPEGAVVLAAADARINGQGAHYEKNKDRNCIGGWKDLATWINWAADIKEPGTYSVSVATSMGESAETDYEVEVAGQKLAGQIVKTKGWDDFPPVVIGEIKIAEAGPCQVAVRPLKKTGTFVGNLRAVVLVKAK